MLPSPEHIATIFGTRSRGRGEMVGTLGYNLVTIALAVGVQSPQCPQKNRKIRRQSRCMKPSRCMKWKYAVGTFDRSFLFWAIPGFSRL